MGIIMKYLILMRHGESESNKANTFGGWINSELSEKGVNEAKSAQPLLKQFFGTRKPEHIYTSRLKRAKNTCSYAIEGLGWSEVPLDHVWQLNERMYGAFQGKNKKEIGDELGADELKRIRRSYDMAPPPLAHDSPFHPLNDPEWADLDKALIPDAESLKMCQTRAVTYWTEVISPKFTKDGCENILIFAHGNSLRALVHHLEHLTIDELIELNIPTATPRVLEFTDDMEFVKSHYLGDPEAIAAAAEAVANQGK